MEWPAIAEVVYLLVNEAMPGLVKIGCTKGDTVEARVAQLNNTSVPLPFECYFAAEVEDCVKLERTLHQLFAGDRINPRREFFRVDPERIVLAIGIGKFRVVTPGAVEVDRDEQDALEKQKARRPAVKLVALGILPGAVLSLSRDESITATVIDDARVKFQGEILSLSAAALKALHSLGYSTPAASGPGYWMYEGELLSDRRRRIERDQFGGTIDDVA